MTKCKYEVYTFGKLKYWFVTTTRNLEDCIELMKEKFKDFNELWCMYNVVDGVRYLVFNSPRRRRRPPQKVKDLETGIIYPSSTDCADALALNPSSVRRHISQDKKKIRFIYVNEDGSPIYYSHSIESRL